MVGVFYPSFLAVVVQPRILRASPRTVEAFVLSIVFVRAVLFVTSIFVDSSLCPASSVVAAVPSSTRNLTTPCLPGFEAVVLFVAVEVELERVHVVAS